MYPCLRQMVRELEGVVSQVVVDELTPAQATELLRDAAALERRAGVLKTLVARRATDDCAWAAAGHSSPESWLGDETGSGFARRAQRCGRRESWTSCPA